MKNDKHHIKLIAKKLNELLAKPDKDSNDLNSAIQLFTYFFECLSDNESVGFTTLFSRIAYVAVRQKFPSQLLYENHIFRRQIETGTTDNDAARLIQFAAYLIQENVRHIYKADSGISVDKPIIEELDLRFSKGQFKRMIKGLVMSISEESEETYFFNDEAPHVPVKLVFESADFNRQFRILSKNLPLPININLVDVRIDDGIYYPKAFVARPNFMVGVTSISECFQSRGSFALKYLVGKLVPSDSSIHMLIGNIVNYFLDELIHDPELEFSKVVNRTFKLAPESFSLLNDSELKDCLDKINYHFSNLQKVVKNELADAGITKEQAYLEPSFYSDEYGISGRLDLYHYNENEHQSDIIELKSGKLFKANSYGLNENHFTQTLLYDLIIESIYQGRVKSTNYILYSYLDKQRLRYAPRIRAKQYDALLIRNDIMMIEHILSDFENEKYAYILDAIHPDKIPGEFTFVKRESEKLVSGLMKMTDLELAYYKAFVSFLSREYALSKTGEHGVFKSNGMASLWLDPLSEKIAQFTVLAFLKISTLKVDEDIPVIELAFSENSNRLSKFRIGDIVVLYPFDGKKSAPLKNQIFKCTILKTDSEKVVLRLRARQKNADIFRMHRYWNVESDVLDSGFQKQFHSLFDFIYSPVAYRQKIFGQVAPDKPGEADLKRFEGVTDEQNRILNDAICSKDYYLLWGPPGTGKTSVMIRHLVDHYYSETETNILLLAYTNRAVDEICAAIHDMLKGQYIRIGSRYSTAESYRNKLFNVQAEAIKSRKDLLALLENARIYVSTISSFQSKRELVKLKKFDIAIVDEASQLLEPMLVGFLSQFEKFILIGDHKQLPAVVAQDEKNNKLNEKLTEIGLTHCGVSLFERMYKNAIKYSWDWAYGGLSHQGRMHQDILKFVSTEFYKNKLRLFPGIERLNSESNFKGKNAFQSLLIKKRMLFVDSQLEDDITSKSNSEEAKRVALLIREWFDIYRSNQYEYDEASLGVITPFRAQIARIRDEVEKLNITENFTIDTIERYQGGSRNQIIISLAVNQADLLDSITNVSNEGIDRKLNVALTRAKEHIVIFGTKDILMQNQTYSNLISYCEEVSIDHLMTLKMEQGEDINGVSG